MQHYLNSLFVLLVEPSRSQRKIVVQQMEELGISQYEAVDTGQEALAVIDTDQPDLVISTMFLDDMTGKELVLEMRENPVTIDIPFMLISSETSFSELNPIKQAGASAVLPKPFKAIDLKRAIHMIMDWANPDMLDLDDPLAGDVKVLLVDDSKLARRLITRTLNNLGIESITEAENGRDAIPLIQQQKFDLIITDYNMPEMDGHELLLFIRHRSNQKSVPVMLVTTEGDESKLSAIQHEGVSAIMDKPFEALEVKKLFESVFIDEE
ncbi:MAG: response regulator [Gammaproteobacteria bacterium]|jgi:two-component system chemotaxis response regulator CheY|nr:response regulator [Gammaproteobacteria bacterium]MBT3722437.1 response regulator [Gammaproteobacteria bacterium]MBT4078300.1 response regulator [Gammaproteobacteria bacterium]MBT4196550.1 response regulator [Gammaproteobacteria bacterium]MBT4450236.1 response regulator [Gammaproteobacteria bacterium]